MRILLHVGVHKSATTAVEHALFESYGSVRPGKRTAIWYPDYQIFRPGHAILWFELVGIGHHYGGNQRLRETVAVAEDGGCETLVISAEDICLSSNAVLETLGKEFHGHVVDVYVTMSPLAHRLYSTWQENVKHGWGIPFAESGTWYFGDVQSEIYQEALGGFDSLTPSCRESGWPTFRIDLLRRLASHLHPSQLHLIPIPLGHGSVDVFNRVSEAFGVALAVPTGAAEIRLATQSLGCNEADYICRVNAAYQAAGVEREAEAIEFRHRCLRFFREMRPPRVHGLIPETLMRLLTGYWNGLCQEVAMLEASGLIQVHGALKELNDLD